MGVKVDKGALRAALERAVRIADSGADLPELWVQRTEHISESPNQTMVAVLGNALLARATLGKEIDPRSIKARSGPRGYSARGTVAVLVAGARDFGFDLGVNKAEPLNNQPFFHVDRVDAIPLEDVRPATRPYLRALNSNLRDIDSMTEMEAELALTAFISVRRRAAEEKWRRSPHESPQVLISLPQLARTASSFVSDRPESGRRGQALAAAALDCTLPRVELGGVHDPDPFDVLGFRKKDDEIPSPVVQVKQKPVGEDTAVELAEAAADAGVGAAILLAIASNQPTLDRDAIAVRTEPLDVIVLPIVSVSELLSVLGVLSAKAPRDIALRFPRRFENRMGEIGCEDDAIKHWQELVSDLLEP